MSATSNERLQLLKTALEMLRAGLNDETRETTATLQWSKKEGGTEDYTYTLSTYVGHYRCACTIQIVGNPDQSTENLTDLDDFGRTDTVRQSGLDLAL